MGAPTGTIAVSSQAHINSFNKETSIMQEGTRPCARRHFLVVLGAAAAVPTAACSDPSGVEPAKIGDVSAGNVSGLPEGTLLAVGNAPVAIGRDANGLYAMTLTCTHEGCNIALDGSVDISEVHCGCHGARFDGNGNVKSGPAPDPLVHFAVEVDAAGNILIRGDQRVGSNVRTPVA